jgi:transposase
MWTPETRVEHDRDELRYPSDLTDAEWQILAPLLPPPAETGRRRSWPMRELMNALFFVLRGGCPLPAPAKAGGGCRQVSSKLSLVIRNDRGFSDGRSRLVATVAMAWSADWC